MTFRTSCDAAQNSSLMMQKISSGVATKGLGHCLQEDFARLESRSDRCFLPFIVSKCSVLHLGRNNTKEKGKLLQHYHTNLLRKTLVCTSTRTSHFVVKWHLQSRKLARSLVLYERHLCTWMPRCCCCCSAAAVAALVRPHLEYANIIWGPFDKADKVLKERVQRRATRLIPSLCDLSYESRTKNLKLPSL